MIKGLVPPEMMVAMMKDRMRGNESNKIETTNTDVFLLVGDLKEKMIIMANQMVNEDNFMVIAPESILAVLNCEDRDPEEFAMEYTMNMLTYCAASGVSSAVILDTKRYNEYRSVIENILETYRKKLEKVAFISFRKNKTTSEDDVTIDLGIFDNIRVVRDRCPDCERPTCSCNDHFDNEVRQSSRDMDGDFY